MTDEERNRKAVKAVHKVLNKSDKEKEQEWKTYLKKTKGKSQMTKQQWYKFNYNQQIPSKKEKKFKTVRTKRIEEQLRKANLSEKDIAKLRGK